MQIDSLCQKVQVIVAALLIMIPEGDEEIVGDLTQEALAEVNQEANEYKHVDQKAGIVRMKNKTKSADIFANSIKSWITWVLI